MPASLQPSPHRSIRRPMTATIWFALSVVLILGGLSFVHSRRAAHLAFVAQERHALQSAMEEDTTASYREVVGRGQALEGIATQDGQIEEMVTYAATILAVEHQDEAMRALSQKWLRGRAAEQHAAQGQAPSADISIEGYGTAAQLLARYGEGELTDGLALAEAVQGQETGLIMAKLEGLRLMVAAKVELPKVAVAAQDLAALVTDEVRALSFLALWQLSQNNTALAEQYLNRALGKNPRHPQALLGQQWVRLQALHPNEADLWQAHKVAGEVLRLPASALAPPVRAMALLLRAQALELEGDAPRAERDRAEAMGTDPGHLLHETLRDGPARP